jgi:hypothetical protein
MNPSPAVEIGGHPLPRGRQESARLLRVNGNDPKAMGPVRTRRHGLKRLFEKTL